MTAIKLTSDQNKALEALTDFVLSPDESLFVLEGYSGTGKSTTVNEFLNIYDKIIETHLLVNPDFKANELILTATTNKAAESLQRITNRSVRTIHSALGLRVSQNFRTNETFLVPAKGAGIYNSTVLIDEGSYISPQLLNMIFKLTHNCKIIFIGDPAQLLDFKSKTAPVFNLKCPKATLEKVVRQKDHNPIIELGAKFRNTVNTGEFFSFTPDGHYIKHVDRSEFDRLLTVEFDREDWHFNDSKILAWTNRRVINYNQALNDFIKGTPLLDKGDYAVCNSYIQLNNHNFKTDQLVHITDAQHNVLRHGVMGAKYQLDGKTYAFCPYDLDAKNQRLEYAQTNNELSIAREIIIEWIDLRSAFSCTINKSQGSTYRKVFIDLDDLKRCNNGNSLARMLYVAVTRASEHVIFTGDLV